LHKSVGRRLPLAAFGFPLRGVTSLALNTTSPFKDAM
jgi:hypothetical protein